jgi:hypothetical protein
VPYEASHDFGLLCYPKGSLLENIEGIRSASSEYTVSIVPSVAFGSQKTPAIRVNYKNPATLMKMIQDFNRLNGASGFTVEIE